MPTTAVQCGTHQRPPFGYKLPVAPDWPIPHWKDFHPKSGPKNPCAHQGGFCLPQWVSQAEQFVSFFATMPPDFKPLIKWSIQSMSLLATDVEQDIHDLFSVMVPFVTKTIDWVECIGNHVENTEAAYEKRIHNLESDMYGKAGRVARLHAAAETYAYNDTLNQVSLEDIAIKKWVPEWTKTHIKSYIPPDKDIGSISQAGFDKMADIWWGSIKKPTYLEQKTFDVFADRWWAGIPKTTGISQKVFNQMANKWFVPVVVNTINPLSTGLGFLKKLFPSFNKAAADALGHLLDLLKKILPWLEYLAKHTPGDLESLMARIVDNLFTKMFAKAKLKKLPFPL